MTPLHEQARALALAGIKVFPCLENAKFPATPHGFQDATTSVDQIDAWWGQNPNYNVALCPEDAGWCVIDLDPGGEPHWIKLLAENGEHAPTYEVETPRGGRHLYFEGSLPGTTSKLGDHVDTRGVGSYVLVPPSRVNGKPYRVLYDRNLVAIPSWVSARLATRNERLRTAAAELDTPVALNRARVLLRDYISRGHVAVSGCGGNNLTYQVAAEVAGLGVSGDQTLRLLLDEGWNDACQPPWDADELSVIVGNAGRYAQNDAGVWAVPPAEDAFGQTEAFRQAMKEQEPRPSRYRMMSASDFDNEPEPTWIIPGLLPADSSVLWVGPSQSFKSFLLLDAFLGVATGTATFGATPEKGLCIYGAIEDLRNIGKSRRRAWQTSRGMGPADLDGFRACLVPFLQMPGDVEDWHKEIEKWLGGRRLALMGIDTAGKVLGGLNENAAENVRLFWKLCDDVRERYGCTVVAVHHSGKDEARGARGSSAWLADFDSVIETRRPSPDQLAVEVTVRKHKNAADAGRWTFRGSEIAGSLVFSPTTASEHRANLDEGDAFAAAKISRVLAAGDARSLQKGLQTAELLRLLGGRFDDERGIKTLETLAKTKLQPYCVAVDGTLWWFLPAQGE